MNATASGVTTVVGRVFIALIFLMSALGNKIPNFSDVAGYMGAEGVPMPQVMLTLGIVFLIVGATSVMLGYHARIGAGLLLVFLILATWFFHDFWTLEDAGERQMQTIQFMKNLSLMGAMLVIMANGAGRWSLDARRNSNTIANA